MYVGQYKETRKQRAAVNKIKHFAFMATCFSQRGNESLCWAPIILEQTLTIPFKLFLYLTENPLNKQINEKV